MSEKSLIIMHPFSIRYMYEPPFSTLEIIKKRSTTRYIESALHVCLSTILVYTKNHCTVSQAQISYLFYFFYMKKNNSYKQRKQTCIY